MFFGLHSHHPHAARILLFRIRSYSRQRVPQIDFRMLSGLWCMTDARYTYHSPICSANMFVSWLAPSTLNKRNVATAATAIFINIMLIPWFDFRIRSQRLLHSGRCHRHITSHICKHESNSSIFRRYEGVDIFPWQTEANC